VAKPKTSKFRRFWLDNKAGWGFLAPFMILFLVFTILPVFVAMGLSFTNYNMILPGKQPGSLLLWGIMHVLLRVRSGGGNVWGRRQGAYPLSGRRPPHASPLLILDPHLLEKPQDHLIPHLVQRLIHRKNFQRRPRRTDERSPLVLHIQEQPIHLLRIYGDPGILQRLAHLHIREPEHKLKLQRRLRPPYDRISKRLHLFPQGMRPMPPL